MATLESLAAEVNTHAANLSKSLAEAALPAPSSGPDAPPPPPHGKQYEKVQASRMALIDAAEAIRDLARGPSECITAYSDVVRQPIRRESKL